MSETNFSVSTQAELNAAIGSIDAATLAGDYTITLTGDITEGQSGQPAGLFAIDAAIGVNVTVDGGGFVLNGASKDGGLAVIAGKVSIDDLTIEDTVAKGGAGKTGGGGGAGLGGGLFVGTGANVGITNVSFTHDSAVGGAGGTKANVDSPIGGGKSSLILAQPGAAGTNGAVGANGTQGPGGMSTGADGGMGVTGHPGGIGGDGGANGAGGAGGMGGTGGRGGTGAAGFSSTNRSSPGGNGGNGGDGAKGGGGGSGGDGGLDGEGGRGGIGGNGGGGGAGGKGGLGSTSGFGGNGGNGADGSTGGKGGAGGFGAGGGDGGAGGGGGGAGEFGLGAMGKDGKAGTGDGNGGRGGIGGDGGYGGGGGGGGEGGLLPNPFDKAARGGTGGTGGAGGFGGGGGGGGVGGAGGTPAHDGLTGNPGLAGAGGFGGGAGNQAGTGGGGLGAGGDIFVAQGGTLTVDGGLLNAGTVTAGTSGSKAGDAFGSGIFLQGRETISLVAPAGQTLMVSGVISDEPGSGGAGATGAGGLVIGGPGSVQLAARNTFIGGIALGSGTLDLAHTGAPGSGTIDFTGIASLEFAAAAAPAGAIAGFAPGDTIEVTGFAATGNSFSDGTLSLVGAGGPVMMALPDVSGSLGVSVVDGNTFVEAAPCYCAGTRIATASGETLVEELAIGNLIRTLGGTCRPIRWIGRRSYAGRFIAGNRDVLPVVIRAGALADGVPARDLQISPKHAMFFDGVLIPAECLVNGRTIFQRDAVSELTYFHVELDSHDVLLAEGAASESFIDCDSRMLFQNACEFAESHAGEVGGGKSCAPRVEDGDALELVRRRLAARAGLVADHVGDAPEAGPLEGRIDVLDHACVSGWAFDRARPRTRVRLEILVDGVVVGETFANRRRADLRHAGLGDGCCAFSFAFADPLAVGSAHRVKLRRKTDRAALPGGVRRLAAEPARPGSLEGRVDSCDMFGVAGWALDTSHPGVPVRLEVWNGRKIIGQTLANLYRPDLAQAGKGDGNCSFAFRFEAAARPAKPWLVRVRRAVDGAPLPMTGRRNAA